MTPRRVVSFEEESFLKRVGIIGTAIISVVGMIDFVLMIISTNYLVLSVGAAFIMAITSGDIVPNAVIAGVSILLMAAYLLSIILNKYAFKSYKEHRGKLTLIAGVALAMVFYYFLWPSLITWLA